MSGATISGGGGGGTTSPLTTKGDLYGYDTANARIPVGANGTLLQADSTDPSGLGVKWAAVAGTGDVTAAAVLADNSIIRGDGGAKGVQDSGILISDTDSITGVDDLTVGGDIAVTGTVDGRDVATDGTKLDGIEALADVTDTTNVNAALATSVGTITTGVWTGTDIAAADGGTGRSSHTAYAVICGGTTTTAAQQSIAGVGTAAQVLTSNGAGALPTFQAAAGGTPPPKVYFYAPKDLSALETNFAVLEKVTGTNVKVMVRSFDDTTEEFANESFEVPGDVSTTGSDTVTFRAYVMAKTAVASKNVKLTFGHLPLNDSEDYDQAYTDISIDDQAIDATQDDLTEITWTETLTNLGWSANDLVLFRFSRESATTTNLAGDMYLFSFSILIPRE